jgi:hypothetical protein
MRVERADNLVYSLGITSGRPRLSRRCVAWPEGPASIALTNGAHSDGMTMLHVLAIIIALVVTIIAAVSHRWHCDVCGLPIRRKYYKWKIEGKDQVLCPKCNAKMERKVSNKVFKDRFG